MVKLLGVFLVILWCAAVPPNVCHGLLQKSSSPSSLSFSWSTKLLKTSTKALLSTASMLNNENKIVVVAMTREEGKNEKLQTHIQSDEMLANHLQLLELPCIVHATGPDYDSLGGTLCHDSWDYVVVTSPEAANVLSSVWWQVSNDKEEGKQHAPKVAAVGKATEKALQSYDIPVSFVPSKATAATLAMELPLVSDTTKVLYPASVRALSTLQDRLESREGFTVRRLNTYDTVTATWTPAQQEESQTVQVACFASPSSIQGWLQNTNQNNKVLAACIGITSAEACQKYGWNDDCIFYPESPGMEGWVESIQQAMLVAKRQQEQQLQPHV